MKASSALRVKFGLSIICCCCSRHRSSRNGVDKLAAKMQESLLDPLANRMVCDWTNDMDTVDRMVSKVIIYQIPF